MTGQRSIFAELARTMDGSVRVSSKRGEWSGRQLLDGAERFAAWLRGPNEVVAPLVAVFPDIVGTTVAMLAADLAEVPVIHVDPTTRQLPQGTVATGVPCAAPKAYADETLGIFAEPTTESVTLTGVPLRSQTFLTSGSTGGPMAVVRDAAAVLADAEHVIGRLNFSKDAPVVVGAPVAHVYGFNYGLVAALLVGASVRFSGPHALPSQLARAIVETGARTLVSHPLHYWLIAQEAVRQHAAVVPGLQQAVSAGGPLPPGAARDVLAHHDLTLFNCYGSSEAGAVTLSPVDRADGPGDAGALLPGVAARTDNGELLLRTASLASGHLTPDGLVPLPLRDGWFPTGDLAAVDQDRVLLKGRLAAVINVSGKKVSPEEVEHVLAGHPAVADAEVRAEEDDSHGQIPVARVVLHVAVPVRELLEWCRARLAPHMVPRRFDILDELPRSSTGKRRRASA